MGFGLLNKLRWLDARSGWLLAGGVLLAGMVNFRLWQRDRQARERLTAAPAAPPAFDRIPRVSFLVPAWNEEARLPACAASILNLRYPQKELVLCAGGVDATYAIAKFYQGPGVIVLEQQPGEGKQGALRRCFERSSGEIIFLTDADCQVDDGCVEATLAPLLGDHENAATGFWQPFANEKSNPFVAYQWANHLRYQAAMPQWADTLDGRNSAVRRAALEAAGAFQNDAPTGTDYVLSQRLKAAGSRIRTVLFSRVQTEYPGEIASYLRQGSRWYRSRLLQGIRFRQLLDVTRSLWGAGAALFTLAGGLALPLRWRAAACAWLVGLLHLVLSQARLAGFFSGCGLSGKVFWAALPGFVGYTLVCNLSMIKGLLDSFDRRGRKVW